VLGTVPTGFEIKKIQMHVSSNLWFWLQTTKLASWEPSQLKGAHPLEHAEQHGRGRSGYARHWSRSNHLRNPGTQGATMDRPGKKSDPDVSCEDSHQTMYLSRSNIF